MKGLLKTAQGALWISWKCVSSLRLSILVEEITCTGLCIERKPFLDSASHRKPLLIFIEQIFEIKFHTVTLHFPFSPSIPCPLISLCLRLCLFQNQCHRHLSWTLWGGQQVEHKHTCLPHPPCLPSWGCWAEGPISGPSEPCNQHCQTQFPVELTGWHSKRCVGISGRLASRWLLLEGSMEHVKPQPVSPGAPQGWTGLALSGSWVWIDPQPSHERPPHISDSKEGA